MNNCVFAGALFASMMILANSPVLSKPIKVSDPESAMKVVYTALERESREVELPLSARLAGLFALDQHETGKDEVGRIDFDYFVNGQDSKVSRSRVNIRTVENGPTRRIVVIRFKNFDQEMENHFFWEKSKSGWVLDDVRYLDGKEGYTLSLVLKYGWDGPEELNESGQ